MRYVSRISSTVQGKEYCLLLGVGPFVKGTFESPLATVEDDLLKCIYYRQNMNILYECMCVLGWGDEYKCALFC